MSTRARIFFPNGIMPVQLRPGFLTIDATELTEAQARKAMYQAERDFDAYRNELPLGGKRIK